MTYLSSYIFPCSNREIVSNLVLGVSLGGHAAWHCLFHDPRVSTAIVVIGCPDYISLMSDRARLSKLPSWTKSSPPGMHFLGSPEFPAELLKAVGMHDPAAMLLGKPDRPVRQMIEGLPSVTEQANLLPLLKRTVEGKRILNLSGADDKLVPYRCGQAFVEYLKSAIAPGSWFSGGLYLEDLQFDDVGHQMSPAMVQQAFRFVADTLQKTETATTPGASKI